MSETGWRPIPVWQAGSVPTLTGKLEAYPTLDGKLEAYPTLLPVLRFTPVLRANLGAWMIGEHAKAGANAGEIKKSFSGPNGISPRHRRSWNRPIMEE